MWRSPSGWTPSSGGIRSVAFPLAVVYKYFDDTGGYLAALITYYGFVSLFPLLLLLSTVLGFVLSGDPHLQQQVLTRRCSSSRWSAISCSDPKRIGGGAAGLVVGFLGSLYGGLGVAQAVPVRDEHRLGGAAQQPAQPVQGPRP